MAFRCEELCDLCGHVMSEKSWKDYKKRDKKNMVWNCGTRYLYLALLQTK